MSKVDYAKPVYHMSLSENSSGYEKKLRDKNLQITELKLYINNTTRCLGKVDILSARKQDHQFNAFTSFLLSYKSIIYKSSSL